MPNAPVPPSDPKRKSMPAASLLLWLWVVVVFAAYLHVLSPYAKPVAALLTGLLAGRAS